MVITLAAAEAAIALAIILSVYRRFKTVNVDRLESEPLAECSTDVLSAVDDALRVSLGL